MPRAVCKTTARFAARQCRLHIKWWNAQKMWYATSRLQNDCSFCCEAVQFETSLVPDCCWHPTTYKIMKCKKYVICHELFAKRLLVLPRGSAGCNLFGSRLLLAPDSHVLQESDKSSWLTGDSGNYVLVAVTGHEQMHCKKAIEKTNQANCAKRTLELPLAHVRVETAHIKLKFDIEF